MDVRPEPQTTGWLQTAGTVGSLASAKGKDLAQDDANGPLHLPQENTRTQIQGPEYPTAHSLPSRRTEAICLSLTPPTLNSDVSVVVYNKHLLPGTMRNAQATEVTQRLEETGNQADYEDRCLSRVNEGELL